MVEHGGHRVGLLELDEAPEVVDVMCDAFGDYPVMRYVLGDMSDDSEPLRQLVHFFVMARVLREEWLFGVRDASRLQAAAIVSRPWEESPPELEVIRQRTWEVLGPDARARYESFGEVASGFEIPEKHVHLNMIGVRHAAQGRRLARMLLERVHSLSLDTEGSNGVSLSTELAGNVPLYEHFGYAVVGSAPVEDAFTTWAMYRRDPASPE